MELQEEAFSKRFQDRKGGKLFRPSTLQTAHSAAQRHCLIQRIQTGQPENAPAAFRVSILNPRSFDWLVARTAQAAARVQPALSATGFRVTAQGVQSDPTPLHCCPHVCELRRCCGRAQAEILQHHVPLLALRFLPVCRQYSSCGVSARGQGFRVPQPPNSCLLHRLFPVPAGLCRTFRRPRWLSPGWRRRGRRTSSGR